MTTSASTVATRPTASSSRLLLSKAPVKSATGVTMKSCQRLPKSGGSVDRLAKYSWPP